MQRTRRLTLLLLAIILTLSLAAAPRAAAAGAGDIVVGYYASWAARQGYTPDKLPAEQFTQINYAFAKIENGRLALEDPEGDRKVLGELTALRKQNPELKIVLSVGGWDESTWFSDVASSSAQRETFARSCLDLIRAHDAVTGLILQREQDAMANSFRLRRKQLRKYAFAADGLLIHPAASQRELTEEGDALHHCVSSYGKRHAAGETAIFFIRRASKPGTPYYTLELDERALKVRQNRGSYNRARTPEVQAFEEKWLAWLQSGCQRDKKGRPVLPEKRKGEAA